MLTSSQLKQITAEARPIIERQIDDALKLAGLRDVVSAAGGDWSQLKALIKAQVKDEETGDGKHVRKILDKADYANAYAEMLGLGGANMNEFNISDEAADQMRQWARDRIASGVDIPEHDADGVIIEPAETPKETQGRASTNDEPSPEAGPQAQASHSQGTGAGTLADREARSTGEAASAGLPTHSEPVTIPPVPTVVTEAGDRDRADSSPAAVSVVASNVTAFRTHNPETHFLNSKGLMRLHGCLNAEVCAGSRSKLCFSCSVQHEGPAHQETGAA